MTEQNYSRYNGFVVLKGGIKEHLQLDGISSFVLVTSYKL